MSLTFSALFIDDVYLKDNSPVGKSVDSEEVYPFVEQAQDIYIQDVMGTPLYTDLAYKLYTGVTFSSEELDVVNIASKSLVYWSVYLALPHLYLKIRNAGVVKQQSQYTENTSLTELKYLREEMSNLGEFWNQRLKVYLCNNHKKFPLYNKISNDMNPSSIQYDSDIYISDDTLRELNFLKKYTR